MVFFESCRRLNHSLLHLPLLTPTTGTGPIHMNSVQCTGREKSITECSFRPVPLYTCKHNHDVAVRCNVPHSGLQATVRGAWLNLLAGAGT